MLKRLSCFAFCVILLIVCTGCSNGKSDVAIQVGKVAWEAIKEDNNVSKNNVIINMMSFDSLSNLKSRFSNIPSKTWEYLPASGWLVEIETSTDAYFVAVKSDMTVSNFCYSKSYAEKTINDAKNETDPIGAMFSSTIISLWGGHELLRAEFDILAYPEVVADTADNLVIHRLTDKTINKIIN